jgi:hypothetical protein
MLCNPSTQSTSSPCILLVALAMGGPGLHHHGTEEACSLPQLSSAVIRRWVNVGLVNAKKFSGFVFCS